MRFSMGVAIENPGVAAAQALEREGRFGVSFYDALSLVEDDAPLSGGVR